MATLSAGRASANSAERLVRSRQRVADHGEVFTSRWLVDEMLDLVKIETERIDSRFLEPAFVRKSGVSRHILQQWVALAS